MRELKIEEQKNICGGQVNYVFEDYTTGFRYESISIEKAYNVRKALKAQGDRVGEITEI